MDKQKQIVEMFDSIAPSYDLANRVLSLGIDVRWRREACKKAFERIAQKENLNILDVACGTGDMILHWQNQLIFKTDKKTSLKNQSQESLNPSTSNHHFIGIDPSQGMLEVAQKKVQNCVFLQAQAQELPIESESIDILSIAYGLRNVCQYPLALAEFNRVLKKGGVLVILEFMRNPNPSLWDSMGLFYTQKVLPFLGGLISKNKQAYEYLPDSIGDFASLDELKKELQGCGFEDIFAKSYHAKISSLILASKKS